MMLIRRRARLGRPMVWGGGRSFPVGYAAISFVPPRRRRGTAWIWVLAATFVIATGSVIWMVR